MARAGVAGGRLAAGLRSDYPGAMCNLYNMRKNVDEVARLFRVTADPPGNAGEIVYPGYPGYVVAEGRVRQMTWGFPLPLKGRNGQPLKPKPVNNCRTDKLDSSCG